MINFHPNQNHKGQRVKIIQNGMARWCSIAGLALVLFAGGLSATLAQNTTQQRTRPAAEAPKAVPEPPAQPAVRRASAAGDLEAIKDLLDQMQQVVLGGNHNDETLSVLRERLAPLRDGLRAKLDVLDPRLAEVDNRLSQLGAAPAAGAPPESPALAAERSQLAQTRADVDASIKQTRLLAVRADEIATRINENRRTLFSRALFVRTPGVLDLDFWREAMNAATVEGPGIATLSRDWWNFIRDNGGLTGGAVALVTIIAFAIATAFSLRWMRRRFGELAAKTRFGKALAALAVLTRDTVTVPLVFIIVLKVLDGNGLMPADIGQLGLGLAVAIAVASFGRAVAIASLAPDEPQRRLVNASDIRTQQLASYLAWSARAVGATIFLNLLHKTVSAPLSATVLTSALLALAVGGLTIYLLMRMPPDEPTMAPTDKLGTPGLRFIAWVFAATLAAALVTGFIGFAAFLAGRGVVLLAMIATFFVCATFIDTLFSDVITAQTERGRRMAVTFGISPRGLELVGTLLAAVAKVLLALLVVLPVLGPWGVFAADFFGVVQDAVFGFRIGELTISVGTILSASAILLVGTFAIRALQRWLERNFLPRTRLDPGLQNSVSSLFGYAGFIIIFVFTLAEIGIDLQKIALIAGALSVGIGFGLQAIVSNFVSGIILLAERPIRVGDRVVIKNEEGIVRRISVRATEIATYDCGSVIIPNSDLISGVVKNWTHADTIGRVNIKVSAAYNSDVEQVRDLLMACTKEHPEVEQSSPPSVLLSALGEKGIDFDVFCMVPNVARSGGVKSDIYFDILKRFREAGIVLAAAGRSDVWLHNADEKPSADAAKPVGKA
jgi:small-conductance mechanosensitive channel